MNVDYTPLPQWEVELREALKGAYEHEHTTNAVVSMYRALRSMVRGMAQEMQPTEMSDAGRAILDLLVLNDNNPFFQTFGAQMFATLKGAALAYGDAIRYRAELARTPESATSPQERLALKMLAATTLASVHNIAVVAMSFDRGYVASINGSCDLRKRLVELDGVL